MSNRRSPRKSEHGCSASRTPYASNILLIKINQGVNEWEFGAALETVDGRPLPEVEARLTP